MIRTGLGYDSHRLLAGRRLVLGGVEIPGDIGLDGHSDADVLTHAVIDALLGAAGLGDIGDHFPDTAAEYRDADSIALLREVAGLVGKAGWGVVNLDATVVIERPRLGPHKSAMRLALADAVGLEPGAVNVKATTGEAVGFVGRGEGAAALAVATIASAADRSGSGSGPAAAAQRG
jgi:2-C-methyl-D-erythritol 2,4-cyclodiphosphate synthase